MKIAYVTVKLPYGKQETFIIPEIKEVMKQGHRVLIFPFRPDDRVFHREAESLKDFAHHAKLFSPKVFGGFFLELIGQPLKGLQIIGRVLLKSRGMKVAVKNIAALLKGFYAARVFRKEGIQHIHAHWASTPSTVAYIANNLTNIPWSFTAHRWDIAENNLLSLKEATAAFVRAIDKKGRQEIIEIINAPPLPEKVKVIHMGVDIPKINEFQKKTEDIFTVLCPANLVPKKGHKYLIEACKFLIERGVILKCLLAGDGPLEDELKFLISSSHLESYIELLGRVPHEKLIGMYRERSVDLVVLPSIVTEDGEKEGIPVALMEAMAYGIPVISTETGGIPELVDEDCGYIVKDKEAAALAEAIHKLVEDKYKMGQLAICAYRRIKEKFNNEINTRLLVEMMLDAIMRGK